MIEFFKNSDFEEKVIETSRHKPILVEFYSEWCGPCQIMAPTIEELAEEVGDKKIVGRVNIEEEKELAEKYSVLSLPTMIIFKGGQAAKTITGLQTKDSLLELFN